MADQNNTTRRGVMLAAATTPLMVGVISAHTPAAAVLADPIGTFPDAPLFRAVAEFAACCGRNEVINATPGWSDAENDAASTAWDAAAEAVMDITPATLAGLKAKAGALKAVLLFYGCPNIGDGEAEFDAQADASQRFAMALVRNVLALEGGAA